MRMKHWAYIGIALVAVNASLFRGVRAAELTQIPSGFNQPRFWFMRLPFEAFSRKPPKEMVSPVTVRLLSAEKLDSIWLKNSTSFVIGNQRVLGPLQVSIGGAQLQVS